MSINTRSENPVLFINSIMRRKYKQVYNYKDNTSFRVPNWIQYMQTHNSAPERFKRANGGYMLRNTSRILKILPIHAKFQKSNICHSNPYYHAITKENILIASWVPLLPGYRIIGKLGVHWETNSDFFASMVKYLKLSGKISIPNILGLCNPIIIYNLQAKQLLSEWMQKTVEETNIRSTMLINTEQYLTIDVKFICKDALGVMTDNIKFHGLKENLNFNIMKVKGHSRNQENELADHFTKLGLTSSNIVSETWPSSTRAELCAIFTAILATSLDTSLTIYTDSQAAIDGIQFL
ncbi:hypothetical protein C1645_834430 [Glomus cerebriforme]|uniref:RNase H type-1 domain-containing protein n=1 Tax=Glomus cerebriforme TaxID=658196 RepID=A0A397S9L3_9GLOM|nr:hypothetical protein C1645_834430 [Glomus cerebriforme]